MESFDDSPSFDRHLGNDESVAARLLHTQSPRDPRSDRRVPGRKVKVVQVVRTPRGGFGLGCLRRYGDAPTHLRSFRRLSHRPRPGCRSGIVAAGHGWADFGDPVRTGRTFGLGHSY